MLQNDDDIIRGLGFVTLHGAYVEEQIDNLLLLLGNLKPFTEKEQKWPISVKIRLAKEIVAKVEFESRDDLLACLDAASGAFEHRNEVVHGRIYANFDRPEELRSGRPNVPTRTVDSKELYDLANYLNDLRSAIYRPMLFKIPRALAKIEKG